MREKNVFFLYYNINFFICQASALILSIGAPVLFNTDGRPTFVLNIGRIWDVLMRRPAQGLLLPAE